MPFTAPFHSSTPSRLHAFTPSPPVFPVRLLYLWQGYGGVFIPTTLLTLLSTGCSFGAVEVKGIAVGNGCTGTDAGPGSAQRSANTFHQLAKQGFVSDGTFEKVLKACRDSEGFTAADEACQRALLMASDEVWPPPL